MSNESIAIIGVACQYPDACDPTQLWENILAGRRAFRRLPDCRLRLDDYFSPADDPKRPDTTYAANAALITNYEFDRSKFRVVGSTYRSADLAHWLALDVASRVLADAGFPDGEGLPKEQVGVMVGNSLTGEFSRANVMRLRWPYVRRTVDAALAERGWSVEERGEFLQSLETQYKAPFPPVGDETLAGGLSNTIAGRICNYFDFGGGGYTVDGACASSLLAVANACSALAAGDLDIALAGGVDLSLDPFELVGFAKVGALAKGEMRVYDARSAGFWPGEGCGLVLLMRAAEAVAQGRHIYAYIRGWGISSDGSGGITRPEVDGQKLALQRAYRRAGFGADTIGYFEGHGTGTSVGDATELETVLTVRQCSRHTGDALGSTVAVHENGAIAQSRASDGNSLSVPSVPTTTAAIGSIKANIGHTKAAAGIAGLLKATLALHHQTLPPSVGWEQPHPHLTADDASLQLLRQAQPWPGELPLRAAVSAMGFGGINTHVVLEAAHEHSPAVRQEHFDRLKSSIQDAEVFLFAAEDRAALEQQVRRVASYATQLSYAELSDLAAELVRSLPGGRFRAAVVASRPAELNQSFNTLLEWLAEGVEERIGVDRGLFLGARETAPAIGFLFPGQGTAASLNGGAWSVRFPEISSRYAEAGLPTTGSAVATEIAHPAIITASLAGLKVLQRFGIEASVGIGHSLGELAAYHWAGVLDEAALMRLAVARGNAIAERGQSGGAMAGISAPGEEVKRLIGKSPVVIAGLNSPTQTVISGPSKDVEQVVERAHQAELQAVRLSVSHAFHSPLVAGAVEALSLALDHEEFRAPARLVASTITGGFIDGHEELRQLLCRQMTSPVRLMEAVQAAELKVDLWIEVGPGHVLGGIIGKWAEAPVASLDAGGSSLKHLLRAVGAAFALGAPIRTAELFYDRFTRPFDLDWNPTFFVNPCEMAPLPDEGLGAGGWGLGKSVATLPAEVSAPSPPPVVPGRSALDVVRQLVAERAELPLDAVRESDQLLQDLHFSSIAVGSVVADAARALGLAPPVSPTDYARATVGEVAAALDELASTGAAAASTSEVAPAGVDIWVRGFTVELIDQSLPVQHAEPGSGTWQVVAPPDHAFAEKLLTALNERVPHRGVAVCLPADVDEQHVSVLLDGTRKVLEALSDPTPAGSGQVATGDSPWRGEAGLRFILVQHSNVGGGWARTLHLELPHVTTCVVRVPPDCPDAVDWIVAEATDANGYVESHYDCQGARRVPILRLLPENSAAASPPLGPNDVLLVTGGGKGIAAECALDLAKRYGVRLALLGRSTVRIDSSPQPSAPSPRLSIPNPQSPSSDPQLDENLRRFSANEVTFRYISADVTDAAAVKAAVEEIGRTLGPVTALLHGAGGNVPQSLRTLDAAAVRMTLAPKIDGLRNVLSAIDPKQLRLLVTFGSIIARTGLHGEADYAFANEWLTELTENWRAAHPHCRCLAVEWSVWSGVGMGERLGRIDALRRQGITPITPDEGVRLLRQLIVEPGTQTAIVVSGRFGDPPTLRHEQPELPLLRFLEQPRLHVPGVELICDVTLSLGADPYLRDHAYGDMPLLPAVMGLEAMAQVSMALTGATTTPDFEQVALSRPITVPAAEDRTIRLAALVRGPGKVEVVLRSDETGFQADHFRAICRFEPVGTDHPTGGIHSPVANMPINGGITNLLPLNPRQDLYGRILFHRGRFQRVEGYRELSATRCVADVSPDGQARWFGGYLPETLLLGDPAMRDAAIHAIQACIPHGTILPVGIDRVFTNRTPLGGQCIVRAEEREHSGDRFVYDLTIGSADGPICERWEGLRLQRVDTAAPATRWAQPLLAPYLERRLAELIPGTTASVAVTTHAHAQSSTNGLGGENFHGGETDWHRQRQLASDSAISAVAGDQVTVLRRADGKPFTADGQSVSAAHANTFTLSIASRHGVVACDAEPIVHRDAYTWNALLPADRVTLARLLAEQSATDDFNAAATRMWSAAECLKKAGMRFDAPLVLRETTPDRWVTLSAGTTTIATWVGAVGDADEPVAVALLVGSGDEVF